jgi:hypothetical protein
MGTLTTLFLLLFGAGAILAGVRGGTSKRIVIAIPRLFRLQLRDTNARFVALVYIFSGMMMFGYGLLGVVGRLPATVYVRQGLISGDMPTVLVALFIGLSAMALGLLISVGMQFTDANDAARG